MRDSKVSLPRILQLHPAIREKVIKIIDRLETLSFPSTVMIRIVQGLRTIDEQNALYAQGRTAPGNIVTWAKGGQSIHNYGLAIDFALMYDKDGNGTYETLSWDIAKDFDRDGKADWMEVVNAFKSEGFVWGGDWKGKEDDPHLELFGLTWAALRRKYDAGNFIPGTKYVTL